MKFAIISIIIAVPPIVWVGYVAGLLSGKTRATDTTEKIEAAKHASTKDDSERAEKPTVVPSLFMVGLGLVTLVVAGMFVGRMSPGW